MNEPIKNSRKILEDAIIIFDDVNSKIDSLIACSLKDFEFLNTNFKKYYVNLQKLSNYSNGLANLIIDFNKRPLFQDLTSNRRYKKEKFFESISIQISKLNDLSKTFNFIQLLLNNIKQDLNTIRLLITNLKFEPDILADYNSLNNNLFSLLKCLEEEEKNAESVCSSLNKTVKFIDEEIYFNTELLGEQFDKVDSNLNYLLSLNQLAQKHQKKLIELERKKASSTSEIITNLQFQDILRQQIEHVQKAHEEITLNLKSSHREGENLTDEELYNIRDINTLQSAQLINSNREYQKAVETILFKINDLNSFFSQYNSLWNQFFKPEGIKLEQLKSTIHELSSNIQSRRFSLTHLQSVFNKHIEEIDNSIKIFISYQRSNANLCNEINLLQQFIDKIESTAVKNKKQNPLNQIKTELQKVNQAFSKFNEVYTHSEAIRDFTGDILIEKLNSDILQIDSISEILIDFNTDMQKLIAEGFNSNIKVEDTSDFNVGKISYYKNFEKEVQEIIKLLDNLLQSINLGRTEVDSDKLKHLEDMYTMENERKVHRMVTGKNESKQSKKDKDDIEFF